MSDRREIEMHDDGLLTCRQCTVRYAWASDFIDLRAERDRYREALERIMGLPHIEAQMIAAQALHGDP